VGYGDLSPHEDKLFVDIAAPGRWEELLDWAESEVTARGLRVASLFVPHEHELADIAAARGYNATRHSLTMEIALDEPPTDGDFGELELRTYEDADHDAVIAAVNDAFAEDPFFEPVTAARFKERYLEGRGFDPTLWQLAWDGDELAG